MSAPRSQNPGYAYVKVDGMNFILHSNHCDANRVFVKFRESADPHGCRVSGWFT